jgi:hypothetical protein
VSFGGILYQVGGREFRENLPTNFTNCTNRGHLYFENKKTLLLEAESF